MPDSAVFQVLIGLALVFAVFSVAVSRLNEAVLGFFNYRGRQLEAELRRLTNGGADARPAQDPPPPADGTGPQPPAQPRDMTAELLDGPLRGLRGGGHKPVPAVAAVPPVPGRFGHYRRARRLRLPSYLPSTAFARAVLDLVEPPARALLRRISPDAIAATFPDSVTPAQRDAYAEVYRAAYAGLTTRTAAALHAAMPESAENGRAVTSAILSALRSAVTAGSGGADDPLRPLAAELARLPESPLKDALIANAARAGADRDKIIAELAQWYDDSMDRLSGWYKRRIARFLLVYAILFVVAFNLDVVGLTRVLWQDSAVRLVAVSQAEARSATAQFGADPASTTDGSDQNQNSDPGVVGAVRDIGALQLPFGWTRSDVIGDPRAVPDDAAGWAVKALGWLMAVFALSAGAPFWFDLLGRLVNMRSAGPKPKATAS
jgi:hypothetical protein